MEIKMLAYSRGCDDEVRYQVISGDDVASFDWVKDKWVFRDDFRGDCMGVRMYNGKNWESYIDDESDCNYFEIFDTALEFIQYDHGVGYDLVEFTDEDGCRRRGLYSRWQGNIGYIIMENENLLFR